MTRRNGSDWVAPSVGPTLEFLTVLWELNHALEVGSKRTEAALGVTAQQRMIIRILGRFPGLVAGQLAGMLRIHPGTLSTALRRLEQRRLLTRRRDPADRRRVVLGLTKAGRKFDSPAEGTIESAVANLLERVPARQLDATRKSLRALVEILEAQAAEKR